MRADSTGWIERGLERLRGTPIVRDLASYAGTLDHISALEPELAALSDAALAERAARLGEAVRGGTVVDSSLVEAFAVVREASRRALGQRPFDVQVLAGLVLHDGDLAEMQTGEGKTLAAVAPAWLNSLGGRGAHLLTFNDYLARRDAEWMGPIYEMLGSSVGVIQEGMSPAERRCAYAADVTYATAKEAGFDLLRGLLCRDPDELVHRPFHYAIVDEADSILIDEARVPLVIAGRLEEPADPGVHLSTLVEQLDAGTHYETDEHQRNVNLTGAGYTDVEDRLGCGNLLAPENLDLLTGIHCALHARVLLRRDVDYIVRDGRIELIDEFTGRVVEDRHLPDGLQAAVQAKESIARDSAGTILGSVTLQHFLAHYPKLAGMTATAHTAAEELREFYGLTTVVIPSNRPSVRVDHPDVVFTHREAKESALIDEIRRVHETGRPILVGTASVAESEQIAARLRDTGTDCQVLNAKRDDLEAEIVADAGSVGAVTLSTNMAGRGTDIRLGGRLERDRDRVVELGGLYVIGTNRHESRRIDNQLRGRAGRQGDPGSTRFLVSLEDPLISRFGVNRLIPEKLRPERRETSLDDPIIAREIQRAQRIIEGENLEIRRTLTKYSRSVEDQRVLFHQRRQEVLVGTADHSFLAAAAPERYRTLLDEWGQGVVDEVERQVTLARIDRAWCEHLAYIADLRESIHLVSVARLDPLVEFQKRIIEAYDDHRKDLDAEIVATFERVAVGPEGIDLDGEGLKAPSSTWTYLISDDPFRDQIFARLGGTNMGIGIVFNLPIVLAWWLYMKWRKNKRGSSSG